jgi:hypothetical protein
VACDPVLAEAAWRARATSGPVVFAAVAVPPLRDVVTYGTKIWARQLTTFRKIVATVAISGTGIAVVQATGGGTILDPVVTAGVPMSALASRVAGEAPAPPAAAGVLMVVVALTTGGAAVAELTA